MAYMQMQERMRKEDQERSDFERHAQQKAHEIQIQMLQEQLMAMSARSESGPKSSSKMPLFDLVKDKDSFKLWKSRWELHIQGHKFDSISNSVERNVRLRAELNSCLSDDTLNWLLNNSFSTEDLAKAEFVLQAIELKVCSIYSYNILLVISSNYQVHQIKKEMWM